MEFPKILLITEAIPYKDAVGASRTLMNLLSSYPSDKIQILCPGRSFRNYQYLPPFNSNPAFFQFDLLPDVQIRNRIGLYSNKFIKYLNLIWAELQPLKIGKSVASFQPDVILAVPLFPETLVITKRVLRMFPQIPGHVYLMDDWITKQKLSWGLSNLQKTAGEVLHNSAWLMISNELRDKFKQFYGINDKPCFIVHNPVEVLDFDHQEPQGKFSIAYAGSIWDMHFDGLKLIAEAISELVKEGHQMELVLYCSENFYQMKKDFWDNHHTRWGGMIPYEKLRDVLKKSDLLLVTTAFQESVAHLVRTSVLTKTTDYMNACKPMLGVGPEYSATNRFIEEWKIGYLIMKNDLAYTKQRLLEISRDKEGNLIMAKHAWQVLKDNFSASAIINKLLPFLTKSKNK